MRAPHPKLLGIEREPVSVEGAGDEAEADWENLRTPETYLGYWRNAHVASPGDPPRTTSATATPSPSACTSATGPSPASGRSPPRTPCSSGLEAASRTRRERRTVSAQELLARLVDELPAPARLEPFAFLDDELLPLTLTPVEPTAFVLACVQAAWGPHGPKN